MNTFRKSWTPAKVIMFLLVIFILPGGSFLYLKYGLDYYKSRLNELGDYGTVQPFTAVTHTGDTLTEQSFNGKMTVVGFFSADSPAPCDSFTHTFSLVQGAFPENYKIQLYTFHTTAADSDAVVNLEEGSKWYWMAVDSAMGGDHFAQSTFQLTAQNGCAATYALVDSSRVIRNFYDALDQDEVNRMIVHLSMTAPRPPKKDIFIKKSTEK